MNHIDDKNWEDNFEEITLHGVNHDIHLEMNPILINLKVQKGAKVNQSSSRS
jgi:hypothetical protein